MRPNTLTWRATRSRSRAIARRSRSTCEAGTTLAVDYTDQVLDPAQGRGWRVNPGLPNDVAWTHRVGSVIRGRGAPDGATVIARNECAAIDPERVAAPSAGVSIDRKRGTFAVATPRTCGVFACGGRMEAGALRVVFGDETHAENAEFAELDSHAENAESAESAVDHSSPVTRHSSLRGGASAATVFATSLDGAPLAESRRILVTHLTDCRARGFATTDELGSIILRWNGAGNPDGTMPLFLKEGTAQIELALTPRSGDLQARSADLTPRSGDFTDEATAGGFVVHALGTDGRRECEVPCAFDPATGLLRFTASVRQPFGGCMLYELVRDSRPAPQP